MEYQASAKYLRISTRKMRLVADAIRHLPPTRALSALSLLPKRGGLVLRDVIGSAIANAKQKNAKEETLRTARITVSEGPRMKRWQAASRGMAHPYKKRMTHITVVLTDDNKALKEPIVKKGQ
jgi:large subunit ribosomal protein L22